MSLSVDLSPVVEIVADTTLNTLPPVVASVTVDFDKSVLIQMAIFATLILVLKPLLIDPMLRVFSLREERTDGAKSEARSMQEKAAEILTNYESEVAKVRAEAAAQRDELRKDAAQLEAKIIDEARAGAEAITSEGRLRIEAEVASLESDLAKQGTALAKEIGSRVLGRSLA